jgi:hypothetical protein
MSGLDTSQEVTEQVAEHADEAHVHSRPHDPISGRSPLAEAAAADTPAAEPADDVSDTA